MSVSWCDRPLPSTPSREATGADSAASNPERERALPNPALLPGKRQQKRETRSARGREKEEEPAEGVGNAKDQGETETEEETLQLEAAEMEESIGSQEPEDHPRVESPKSTAGREASAIFPTTLLEKRGQTRCVPRNRRGEYGWEKGGSRENPGEGKRGGTRGKRQARTRGEGRRANHEQRRAKEKKGIVRGVLEDQREAKTRKQQKARKTAGKDKKEKALTVLKESRSRISYEKKQQTKGERNRVGRGKEWEIQTYSTTREGQGIETGKNRTQKKEVPETTLKVETEKRTSDPADDIRYVVRSSGDTRWGAIAAHMRGAAMEFVAAHIRSVGLHTSEA
ncbi:hypothetical protein NDU88_008639 [Pleurodeles waltl]|uniref:Uncharacterized protein n=1 Tax=Pleurodeles waltl TaxID=8319 RepID=A0AAV7QQA2_PLEWA|nr:hypothetical protein NDU88_008639 [Pleurodeles waltl]